MMVVVFQVGGGPGAGGGGSAPSEAPGWPAMQSPHWPTAPAVAAAVTGVPTATPTPIAAHPDYGAYHQVSVDHLNQTIALSPPFKDRYFSDRVMRS